MLGLLACMSLISSAVAGNIVDVNCTVVIAGEVKFAPEAANCPNKLSDENCQNFYGNAVVVLSKDDREEKCYKKGNDVDPELVQIAVNSCPKTCGYCCITPAYNCENKRIPRVDCNSVTTAMCTNPAWRSILVDDCPKTCGFCAENGE